MNPMVQSVLATTPPSVWLVAILGITVVFTGLIAIIVLVRVMNRLCDLLEQGKNGTAAPAAVPAPTQQAPAAPAPAPIQNKQEIIAAVCAAVAEEEGVDVSAIRVLSFKKL